MATSYSTNLALALPVQGTESGTWGTVVNSNITNMLDEALGYQAYTATGGADTITIPDGTTGVARSIYIQLNGTGGGSVAVPTAKTKMYFVFNNTASAITFKVTGQTGVSIPAAAKIALVSNGTDIITAQNYFAALTLGAALPVASGGTGTATPSIVAGTNVTVSGTWPNQTVNASSSGTVSSVAATVPSIFSISGSPITTSGTLAMTYSGTALPVANGGTGLTAGTSGGVLAYTASGTLASSGALTQYGVVIGGGAGVAPTSTAAGTAGHVLTANSGSAPTFQAPAASGASKGQAIAFSMIFGL